MDVDVEYPVKQRLTNNTRLLVHFPNRCGEDIFPVVDVATRLQPGA